MQKKPTLIFIALFLVSFAVCAQQADVITQIIDSPQMTCGQAAYIVACYANLEAETFSTDWSLEWAKGEGLVTKEIEGDRPIELAELAGLCMRAWNMPGGLFYTLSKSNRYAYKEFKAKGFLFPYDDSSMTISGARGLNLIFKCMESLEADRLYNPEPSEDYFAPDQENDGSDGLHEDR